MLRCFWFKLVIIDILFSIAMTCWMFRNAVWNNHAASTVPYSCFSFMYCSICSVILATLLGTCLCFTHEKEVGGPYCGQPSSLSIGMLVSREIGMLVSKEIGMLVSRDIGMLVSKEIGMLVSRELGCW